MPSAIFLGFIIAVKLILSDESVTFVVDKTVVMPERRLLYIIFLITALIVPSVVSAQVSVSVTNEKTVSGGKVFYMHEVQKDQTLYSISKAYKVPIDAITRENVIPLNGIQTGQVLKIPSVEPMQATQTKQATPARQPAAGQPAPGTVSKAAVIEPGSDIVRNGIKISKEKMVSSGKTYFLHEVQKGQTLYSIAKAYQVTILDIDRENSIPAGGIQTGQVLRIPASSSMVAETKEKSPAANAATDKAPAATTEAKPKPALTEPQATGAVPAQEKAAPVTRPEPEAKTATADKKEPAAKKAPPRQKKIHKVVKGETLADIAKKYNITVQELKQANKGVIFAMPDMRLVIPAAEDSENQK